MKSRCLLFILPLFVAPIARAEAALCKIAIEDVHKGATKTIAHQFTLKKKDTAERRHFEVANGDYTCQLAFFGLKSGSMISCEYKGDMGQTFFQSDRSGLTENGATNNLAFRHKGAFISIKTNCGK